MNATKNFYNSESLIWKNLKVGKAVEGFGDPCFSPDQPLGRAGRACSFSGQVSDCLLWSLPTGIPATPAHSHTQGKLTPKMPLQVVLSALTPSVSSIFQPNATILVSSQGQPISIENNLGDFQKKLKKYLEALDNFLNFKNKQ